MKKSIKTLILLPVWPLIWLKLGFSLDTSDVGDICDCAYGGCRERAIAMVKWWRA